MRSREEQVQAQIERATGERVSGRFLQLALSAARMGAWERNLATGQDVWSASEESLFGLPSGTFAGTHRAFLELVHPEDRAAVEEAERRAVAGEAPYHVEYRVVRSEGAVRWMAGTGDVLRDAEGRATFMVGVTVDITDRKQAEEERARLLAAEQAARLEAETANRAKDEFLATISHELRTPLTAILGWTQLLRLSQHDPVEVEQAIDTIERNARSMGQLVEDVLDVSRIISGKLRLDAREMELAPVISAALDAVTPAAHAKGISLRLQLDPQAGTVWGDPGRLQQVVWNLLSNAVKFTPDRGAIQVLLRRAGPRLQVRVIDSGLGLNREFLPRVFERFSQADGSTRRPHAGLGLGLAIVRHLVELHGGTVRADSPGVGKGAIFTVELPLSGSNQISTGEIAEAGKWHGADLNGIHVLVVDDEPDALEFMRRILVRSGAEVTTAGSAAAALAAMEQSRPMVLLSDIGMAEEDGYDLIRQVRALEAAVGIAAVPAIAFTAFAGADDRGHALDAGYQVHVPKPVEPHELLSVIAKLAALKPGLLP